MSLLAFYCDHFVLPLPDDHRFPMRKYALLREQAVKRGILAPEQLCEPDAARDAQLRLAHADDYVTRVKNGTLSAKEIRRIGFPWSAGLVERSRRSVGGTIAAGRAALRAGVAVNLAGGTHHAHRDFGSGFCVFNDVAVAGRTLLHDGAVQRIAIIDADVHQGDGTAAILSGDARVFTFSIHAARNFPFLKAISDLDIALDDHATDDVYLAALRGGLETVFANGPFDLAIFLAGADPYVGDRLGRLDVSKDGLAARDRLVFETCRAAGVPVAVVMAGGYARDVQDIVDIHLQTIAAAGEYVAAR